MPEQLPQYERQIALRVVSMPTGGRNKVDAVRLGLKMAPHIMSVLLPRMQETAVHHNNIKTGSVAVFSLKNGGALVLGAGNRNQYPGQNPTKLCAEDAIMQYAELGPYECETAEVIYNKGPLQPDTQSKKLTKTLCMCGVCRGRGEHTECVTDNTIVVSHHETKSHQEIYTLDDAVNFHEDLPGGEAPRYLMDTPDYSQWREALSTYDKATARVPVESATRDLRLEIMHQSVLFGELEEVLSLVG